MEWESTITDMPGYSLEKTICSGQMFRYTFDRPSEVFTLQSCDKIAKVRQSGSAIEISIPAGSDSFEYWYNYLSISEEPQELEPLMSTSKFLCDAYSFSRGIRILKQDPWETLICFIISQRNSIPKIKSCVAMLCEATGRSLGWGYNAFPKPEEILQRSINRCSLGYRKEYVECAAKLVADRVICLDGLRYPVASYTDAMQELQRIKGVGIKVARCVSLFSLGHTSSFPVDVWIERAMQEGKISEESISRFGEHAGLVQQYIYYYMLHR